MGAVDRQLEAHNQLAELAPLVADPASATGHLRAAAELAEQHCSPLEAARQWFALANHLGFRLRVTEAAAAIERAHAAAEQAGSPALLNEALGSEGLLLALRGKREEAHARLNAALELALRHNLPNQVAGAYRHLGQIREFTADYAGSRDAHLEAVSLRRRQGNVSF